MAERTIPAKTVLICDRCGVQAEHHKGAFTSTLRLSGTLSAVCYDGGMGGGKVRYDFCGACAEKFRQWVLGAK